MKELKPTNKVVLLQKDKEYIFVIDKNTLTTQDANDLVGILEKRGIKGIAVMLDDTQGLKVVEK